MFVLSQKSSRDASLTKPIGVSKFVGSLQDQIGGVSWTESNGILRCSDTTIFHDDGEYTVWFTINEVKEY